jgi:histidine ammonia-lyase
VEEASALAAQVLLGRSQAFHPLVHAAKPHPGQVESARRIRHALRGSRLLDPPQRNGRPVQDRYSIRCVPQAVGPARDALVWARQVLQVELNSVNDNPLVDPATGQILFGGNFFGGHPALVMDTLKIAAASTADLLDRQFALLVDEAHNMGLPETLVPYGGSGVKGLQMACSALTQQAIQRSFSDAVLSRSTECANQDKVSMGLQAALSASEIVSLLTRALATELIALSNAASFRDETKISPAGRALLREIRKRSAVLAVRDRPLDADIERLYRWLESGGTAR